MTTLYGVNKATLDAYVQVERLKIWEAVIAYLEQQPDWSDAATYAAWCRTQAAKETQP